MKVYDRPQANLPTATKSSAANEAHAKPTQAASSMRAIQQRSPEPVHFDVSRWNITTRDDGAVLATAQQGGGEGNTVYGSATLVPPSNQTTGVKTITMSAHKDYGVPVFKITPFEFGDGRLAFGNDSYSPEFVDGPIAALPVVAALRFQTEFVHNNAPGPGQMETYTIRALDSVITLDDGWKRFSTIPYSQFYSTTPFTSTTSAPTTSASLMPSVTTSSANEGTTVLSKAQIAGIGAGVGGLALLVGVGASLLLRRSQMKKRAEATQEFGMNVLSNTNLEPFANS